MSFHAILSLLVLLYSLCSQRDQILFLLWDRQQLTKIFTQIFSLYSLDVCGCIILPAAVMLAGYLVAAASPTELFEPAESSNFFRQAKHTRKQLLQQNNRTAVMVTLFLRDYIRFPRKTLINNFVSLLVPEKIQFLFKISVFKQAHLGVI